MNIPQKRVFANSKSLQRHQISAPDAFGGKIALGGANLLEVWAVTLNYSVGNTREDGEGGGGSSLPYYKTDIYSIYMSVL